ncbi:MAG: hypothetical protein HY909_16205 [Deltaproteobacteria bacterium]|nr:hypothetical protein [Deltaproteobacteria bacterium]
MRPLVALSVCVALACTRSRASSTAPRPRAANTAPRPRAASAAPAVAQALPARPPEREEEELVTPARDLSPYADSEEGLRALVADLARAARGHGSDRERLESLERSLRLDDARVELAFTFDGARALGPALVARAPERLEARVQALRALPEPHTVRVSSALGSELGPRSAGAARPTVRFYRAEVAAPSGATVVLEPVGFLGGRWCYLAEAWTALPPGGAPVAPPAGPSH